jgi:hypothetical protein
VQISYDVQCRLVSSKDDDSTALKSENMARHYSTKNFFRQMPNALLVHYFHAREPLGDLDFSGIKETQPYA